MKIKRNYERIVDELLKIKKYIIVDIVVSLYDLSALRKDFSHLFNVEINHENMIQVISELALVIESRHKEGMPEVMEKIIQRNKKYIEYAGYQNFSLEQLKNIFAENKSPGLHNQGLTPEMVILYLFSENKFNHDYIPELIKEYEHYFQLSEEARKKHREFAQNLDSLPDTVELERYLYEQEELQNIENANWYEIATKFDCDYDEQNKRYNRVKRGFLLFYDVNIKILKEAKAHYDSITETLYSVARKLFIAGEKQKQVWKYCSNISEENRKLKTEVKQLRRQLSEIESKYKSISKSKPDEKDKQISQLLKENYYLKSRIEKLEQTVEQLQKAQEINKEITDDIVIPEQEIKTEKLLSLPEYQKIIVVGGKWNSKEKEILMQFLFNCDVKFIEAEKTIAKIDTISNADIVIFDTSRNAHKYFYIVKENANKLFIINKSNAEEVLMLFQK